MKRSGTGCLGFNLKSKNVNTVENYKNNDT